MREFVIIGLVVLGFVIVAFVGIRIWQYRNRDFRAAVVIENLRLWRELIQEYRNNHPFETYSVDVATEAVYNAMQRGPAQKDMMTRSWDSVKRMTKFIVQECLDGKNVGLAEMVYVNSDLEAAKAVALRCELRSNGKLGELRARVRTAASPTTEALFYADLPHSN